jgi:hypothetical protein
MGLVRVCGQEAAMAALLAGALRRMAFEGRRPWRELQVYTYR